MKKLVIFDFDGTLVDTIYDVVECFNSALHEAGFHTYTVDEFNKFVGGNLETIVSSMIPENKRNQEVINQVKSRYRSIYLNSTKPNSNPYHGINTVLTVLKSNNINCAVNSNKGQVLLEDMVENIFPRYYFSGIYGYKEEVPSKPDPYGVNEILKINKCTAKDAVYIGDGKSDIETAHNASVQFILASWGQTQSSDLTDKRIDYIAKEPLDILHILSLKDS